MIEAKKFMFYSLRYETNVWKLAPGLVVTKGKQVMAAEWKLAENLFEEEEPLK